MKFYFRITDLAHVSERFDYFEPSSAVSATSTPLKQPLTARCIKRSAKLQASVVNNNNNNIHKKIIAAREEKGKEGKEEKEEKIEETKKSEESKENIDSSDKNSVVIVTNDKKCIVKIDKEDKQVKEVKQVKETKELKEKTENIKLIVKNKNPSENKVKDKNDDNSSVGKKEEPKKEELKAKTDLQCISDKSDNKSDNKNKVNKIEKKADKLISETSENRLKNNTSSEKMLVVKRQEKEQNVISDKKDTKDEKCEIIQTKKSVPIPTTPLLSKPSIPIPSSHSNTCPAKSSKQSSELEDNVEKSEFLKSIQLAPKGSPPSFSRPILPQAPLAPILLPPKIISLKRKYVRKNSKDFPVAKKLKITENKLLKGIEKMKHSEICSKIRKIAPKESTDNSSSSEEVKNINNPLVQLMVSNMSKQANSVNIIVEQFDSAKTSVATTGKSHNESLQSLIDSCRLSIPSSLSITLTETSRNEDGSIVEAKPNSIRPVQNYIEILKLPDSVSENGANNNEGGSENDGTEEDKTKEDNKNASEGSQLCKNQKNTFQAMFEEAIKRNETSRAHLLQIQRHAKLSDMVKKAGNNKKPQYNALDLSSNGVNKIEKEQLSPVMSSNTKLYINTNSPLGSPVSTCSQSSTSSTVSKTSPISAKHSPSLNKRNILEIAHQLSKKSRMETTTETPLKIPQTPITTPQLSVQTSEAVSPPKQQVIVNNNFNSGGYLVFKRAAKKIAPLLPKVPIPRLPIQKIPTPQTSIVKRNINSNNGLLKFSNYTAQLATSNSPKAVAHPQNNPTTKPVNNIPNAGETTPAQSTMINGLTPNQFLEKFNITNLAQFNENCLQAQLAFQQACMVSQQFDMQRLHQQNNQKWMNSANMLWGYENYVQSLKKQQNQICGNGSKN